MNVPKKKKDSPHADIQKVRSEKKPPTLTAEAVTHCEQVKRIQKLKIGAYGKRSLKARGCGENGGI